ncbi:hypothetical protein ACFW93_20955 [Streptomyces canus]|uniref:hypothetical protein n=1 Tax=Streptomyces canus TaxID=58343 RepID=UPI0036A077AE
MHERQRKAHSSRRIRVDHGRLEHMTDIIEAAAVLLSHQQTPPWRPIARCEHQAKQNSSTLHRQPCTSSF